MSSLMNTRERVATLVEGPAPIAGLPEETVAAMTTRNQEEIMAHVVRGILSMGKLLMVLWLILLSSCSAGGSDGGSSNASSAAPAASQPSVNPALQQAIVTTALGMTVYYHDHDPPSESYCNGTCEQYWPPVRPEA